MVFFKGAVASNSASYDILAPKQVGIAAGGAAAVAFLPATAAVVMGSAAAGAAAGVLVHVATRRGD